MGHCHPSGRREGVHSTGPTRHCGRDPSVARRSRPGIGIDRLPHSTSGRNDRRTRPSGRIVRHPAQLFRRRGIPARQTRQGSLLLRSFVSPGTPPDAIRRYYRTECVQALSYSERSVLRTRLDSTEEWQSDAHFRAQPEGDGEDGHGVEGYGVGTGRIVAFREGGRIYPGDIEGGIGVGEKPGFEGGTFVRSGHSSRRYGTDRS
mmetsp:Transcript_36400/g.109279  ORF Transcript_36400/g.109279 Transcript_36400/m.109279 type:complete len:204 (+) Transcript_36400:548-1159(+)